MYIYVRFTEKEQYYKVGPEGLVKARLEQASGERCLVVPYQEMSMRVVKELAPRAIAMSGFGGHFHTRKIEWFFGVEEVLREASVPMICFCGSHQLLAFCYQRDIRKLKELRDRPMRRLRPNEHWPRRPCGDPRYDLSGYFIAEGFFPIRQVKADPIFTRLPRTMIMRCWHYCEVKRLPRGFERLASSDHCRIEAMRHKSRPIYSTQFHPEAYDAPFFHGRRMLENFAAVVDGFWRRKTVPRK
jgi:GMP synthase-like glutamine amidotransferase